MRYSSDEGIVLKKNQLLGDNILVTLFSLSKGKIVLKAYGVKKINSKRIAHLETGNYISFSSYQKGSYTTLTETELVYGYSKIRKSSEKLAYLFTYLFVLNRVLPEDQPEELLFRNAKAFLKELNNSSTFVTNDLIRHFDELLFAAGYLSDEKRNRADYDTMLFVEEVIGRKVSVGF